MSTPLLNSVIRSVAAYEGSVAELARETGLHYSWLVMFARGEIENPGVQQIERLHAHFAARAKGAGSRSKAAA